MEVDDDNALLTRVALGDAVEEDEWPGLRSDMLARLDKIAHETFPIPKLPRPPPAPQPSAEAARVAPVLSSPLEPSSQEANKENASSDVIPATQPSEAGALPKQLADMLSDITTHLKTFASFPPHTIQRLAELVLHPRAHYKALAPYLHAVDRVVQVTSGIDTYPLPPAIPDMSAMSLNGEDAKDPAVSVAWSNPTTAALGTDEALGGALLTPIPWLTRRSPESAETTPGAQIHSESTETIDGPNGMGSIETVSVSVNGVPSTGHTRGVTQGELLRQEQRAGVVPVSQLSRGQDVVSGEPRARTEPEDEDGDEMPAEDEETPHARGPEEIGVGDTGLQGQSSSHVSEGGSLEMRDIDVEAAVGRKHEDDEMKADEDAGEGEDGKSPSEESVGTKREAEDGLEGESTKKVKDQGVEESKDDTDVAGKSQEGPKTEEATGTDKSGTQAAEGDGDRMETE